jgi:aconitate hydratase 2/2-methylisocitrate dehydratase
LLQNFRIDIVPVFAPSKKFLLKDKDLLQLKNINKNAVGTTPGKVLHAGSDVRVEVNIVGSQDTTGLMTSQIRVYGCNCDFSNC